MVFEHQEFAIYQKQDDSSVGKESACYAGNSGSIPGLGRSPGEGKGYPLQYSGLENSMDRTVHRVAKSQTRLSTFHFQDMLTQSILSQQADTHESVLYQSSESSRSVVTVLQIFLETYKTMGFDVQQTNQKMSCGSWLYSH